VTLEKHARGDSPVITSNLDEFRSCFHADTKKLEKLFEGEIDIKKDILAQ